jgi:hypothetical protein
MKRSTIAMILAGILGSAKGPNRHRPSSRPGRKRRKSYHPRTDQERARRRRQLERGIIVVTTKTP